MQSTVFLVRHGTPDAVGGNVLGHRDVGLSDQGRAEAARAAQAMAGFEISDIISSPLRRSFETAEILAQALGTEAARDPRLTDFRMGRWEGRSYEETRQDPDYFKFIQNPLSDRIPGGESMLEIQHRSVSCIEQALADNASGEAVVVVSHAGVIRILLAYYLGMSPANYHRLRVDPGSISILRFADDRELPRVLAVNYTGALRAALR